MLELWHNINSVCAQKVRVALAEKGLAYKEHILTLQGDQFDPAYRKLNPNALVPTLVHDGKPVIESGVILYYLDEAFPEPRLMPDDLHERARVRQYVKLIDEYIHTSCMILTFATAFRHWFTKLSPEEREAQLAKAPNKKRSEYKRDVAANGLGSKYVTEAVEHHEKLLHWMEDSLKSGEYLAGASYSVADIAVIPYILRLDLLRLSRMWEKRAGIAQWYERMRARPAFKKEVLDRMSERDKAPFDNLPVDPWPTVETILKAA